ncbi:hypothetical protein V7068_03315, partial [Bacillus sp. JJ634]
PLKDISLSGFLIFGLHDFGKGYFTVLIPHFYHLTHFEDGKKGRLPQKPFFMTFGTAFVLLGFS